jgi:hypothetical protein
MPTTDTQEDRLSKEREEYLWRLLNQMRAQVPLEDFSQVGQWLQDHGEKLSVRELIYFQERLGYEAGMWFAPVWLSRFIAQLLHAQQSTALLDPIGGLGLWAAAIAEQNTQFHIDVVCRNPAAQDLYAVLEGNLPSLHIGSFEAVRPQLSRQYDAIVSFPPIGRGRETRMYLTPTGEASIKDDPSLIAILDAAQLLRPEGRLFILVPPKFAKTSRNDSVRRNLRQLGLYLTALLRVRPGSFTFTSMAFDLVIIERRSRDGLYVAEVTEQREAQDYLIQRLVTHQLGDSPVQYRVAEARAQYATQNHSFYRPDTRQPGEIPAQGRLIDPDTFRSFDTLVAEDTARQIAQHRGLVEKLFSEVVLDIRRPKRHLGFMPCEEHPDAIYLPLMATTDTTTSQATLPEGLKSYVQLIVNPEVALPEYLANLFNTPLGHELRKAAMQGSTIPRISLRGLRAMTLYLPPMEDQRRTLEALQNIDLVRSELNELESRLWDQPCNSADILEAIGTVNHEERFQDWLESLPFPLASTLRAYCTVDQSDKTKYERLLQFFESLAAFCVTILVSACRPNPQIWVPAREKIAKSLAKRSFSPSRPTFGLWRTVLGVLSKSVRRLLSGKPEDRALCLSLFHISNPKLLEVISSKELSTILEQVNTYRNRWTGHGGSVWPKEEGLRHKQISEQLEAFRQLFGTVFTQYELIRPGNPVVLPGPVYQYPAERVMGSNPMLESQTIELLEPAVSGRLHCFSPGQRRALELYPFFQLKETPRAACYFFNRIEKSVPHFVSYHPVSVSEIVDVEQADVILDIVADFELRNQE